MMNKFRMLLRGFAWWILGSVKPTHDEVDRAVRNAFAQVGLNVAEYAPEYVLGTKATAIVFHASAKLGNPIVTVADVKELLS